MSEQEINLDWAAKSEGVYYGFGASDISRAIADAVAKADADPKVRAEAALAAIKEFANRSGGNPGAAFARPEFGGYRVCYESGPYDWAIVASEALCQIGVFAEPYYSFDLIFYED